jgi:hypothetical protein
MAATMARSLKLNCYENTSMVYIYKIQLEHNSCSGCYFQKGGMIWFVLRRANRLGSFGQSLVMYLDF